MLEFPQGLGSISDWVLAAATVVLALWTVLLAREAKKTRLQNIRPHIIVTLDVDNDSLPYLKLSITNVGAGTAFNPRITFTPDIFSKSIMRRHKYKDGYYLSTLSFLKTPLIKPQQIISELVGKYDEMSPKETIVTCSCEDSDRSPHSFSNAINICMYDDCTFHGSYSKKIASSLEAIAKTLERDSNNNRLKRIVSTEEKENKT